VNSSVILLLATSLLIIASGFTWVMFRRYSQRLSRIDEELRAITVLLSETTKETSLKAYMFAQDQRLRDIGEQLITHPDTDMLQQYMQDQTTQILAVISTLDEGRKSGVTKADLEISLRMINELLERVLWSLRFDEDKYVESTDTNRGIPEKQGKRNINIDTKSEKVSKDKDDDISMKSILNDSDDNYGAMLKYMQKSGKSGTEALHALEVAKFMRNS
jgi:hypothetical protein